MESGGGLFKKLIAFSSGEGCGEKHRKVERERSTLSGSDPPSPFCTQDPEPLFPPFFVASIIQRVFKWFYIHSRGPACGSRDHVSVSFQQIRLGLFDYLCDWHRTAGRTRRTPQTDGKNKLADTELMRRTLQRRYPVWTISSFLIPSLSLSSSASLCIS